MVQMAPRAKPEFTESAAQNGAERKPSLSSADVQKTDYDVPKELVTCMSCSVTLIGHLFTFVKVEC